MYRLRKLGLLLLAASLVNGCVARLAYNNADSFVLRSIRDYVSLTDPQTALVRSTVDDALQWLGVSRSAEYAAFLRELGEGLDQRDADDWDAYLLRARDYLDELANVAAPGMAALLESFTPEQREAFFDALEERNVEMQEERAQVADAQAERIDRLETQFRGWLGRLSPEQLALIREHGVRLESTGDMWLAQRRGWQLALREALETPTGAPACERVTGLIVAPQQLWSDEYAAVIERNGRHGLALVAALSPTLSPAQQQRAQRRLDRYARTLEGIGTLAARDWQRNCEGDDCVPPAPLSCPA
ncbi:MAG: hypothetical protein JJU27_10355 [Gammaproteobacteria bacterium]|nr:hypothetical protein [Gammaproteobacteria bacterium]